MPLRPTAQEQILRVMPFLANYQINGPLVIDDLRKPFAAMCVPELHSVNNDAEKLPCGVEMPIIATANRVFCSVLQTSLQNLIGRRFSSVCYNQMDQCLICRFANKPLHQPAASTIISELWTTHAPGGKVRYYKARVQLFYGIRGEIQWVVACFDSMEEFESDSSPLSPSLAISFPSPLLSCLAEEEVGCKGSDCIVMPDDKPSLYHSPTSSCSNPTPHECCAEQKQECSSEGFFLKCSPYQVPPTPSSFLPGDTPLFVSNERSDELSPKEYPLQCHLQEEEGSQKLTCEAFPFSPLSVDCSPSCEDSWLNLDFSESSDQQYTK